MIAQVPELWDGGYWYSFEPTPTVEEGGGEYFVPPVPPPFWSCYVTIGGKLYGACKTPLPVVVASCEKPIAEVLTAAKNAGVLPEAVKFSTSYYVADIPEPEPDPVPAEGP